MFPIVHKRQLSEAVFEMGVEAPRIARKARAGQFLMLRIDEDGERIPLTFSDWSCRGRLDPLHLHACGQDHASARAPRRSVTRSPM